MSDIGYRFIGGPKTGPITQRPEGVSQEQWAAHRREVFDLTSTPERIGGVPVETTVAVETLHGPEQPDLPPAVRRAELPIGWTIGDVVAQSDRTWAGWKGVELDA